MWFLEADFRHELLRTQHEYGARCLKKKMHIEIEIEEEGTERASEEGSFLMEHVVASRGLCLVSTVLSLETVNVCV